jgi:hypothetical protein
MNSTVRGTRRTAERALRGLSRGLAPVLAAVALHAAVASGAAAQSNEYALQAGDGAWELVNRVELGAIYVDTDGIVLLKPDVYQVRTMWRFASPQRDHEGEAFRTSVAVRAVDCQAGSMAILAFADQEDDRTVNHATRSLTAAEWVSVSGSSIVGQIARTVCEKSGTKGPGWARLAGGG